VVLKTIAHIPGLWFSFHYVLSKVGRDKSMAKNSVDKRIMKRLKQKMSEGLFPQWAVTDPEIYEMEIDKIFARTWHFLGHESEIKEPGNFVTRWIVDDPVLLVRTNTGNIKAFLNTCSHRGVHLCTADSGKKKTFTCPYHGWSYNLDGELVGISLGDQVFGEEMKKDEWALRPIPKIGIYQGLIFATLDPNAMSLEDYLGDMKWYFDSLLGRSDGGMEVRGVPQRWVAAGNWKMTYENFTGDPYHVLSTHRSTVTAGITPNHADLPPRIAHQVVLEHGHGINVGTYRDKPAQPYQRMPETMWPMFEKNLTPEQLNIFSRAFVYTGGVYPNLSFVSPMHGAEGKLYNYLNFRVWRPVGPEKVEIWSWFMIDKSAPEEYKESAYRGYVSSFGPSGTLEQDDTENWARIVQASKGYMVRNKELSYNNVINYLMGFERVKPDPSFLGPGVAYQGFNDGVSRATHDYWFELMTKDLFEGEEE
jgi:phenylpropionate dioxygenase-like ring-hydroxylating dioxygenase large terminal subunit